MAKVTAPLFGFSARGQLGKSIVNASWRGRAYVRRYTIPANPRTTAQTTQRNLFRWLQQVYKQAGPLITAPWTAFAKGQPLTNRNAFTQANAKAMFGDTDLSHFLFSAGAKGGLPPSGVTSSDAGAGALHIVVSAPPAPPGWTVDGFEAAAIVAQDPTMATEYATYENESTTGSLVVVTVPAGATYHWGGWLRWLKPDGSFAYSTQVSGTQVMA